MDGGLIFFIVASSVAIIVFSYFYISSTWEADYYIEQFHNSLDRQREWVRERQNQENKREQIEKMEEKGTLNQKGG